MVEYASAAPTEADRSGDMPKALSCLVTGASGYVGGRLIPRLLDAGHTVRATARDAAHLTNRSWRTRVHTVSADLSDPSSLHAAMHGTDVVYYLVHSMGNAATSQGFVSEEAATATNAVTAARRAGVRRIVYLGGLHPPAKDSSEHLKSRTAVGEILMDSGIETVALQAGIVIGAGSASFEMIRHLTNTLRVMPLPRWVNRHRVQPIAIDDVLHYLTSAATAEVSSSRSWDIGGPEVMAYRELIEQYAHVAGLPSRRLFAVPGLSPALVGWTISRLSGLPNALVTPLVHSLRTDTVAHERDIDTIIDHPVGGLTPYRDAVAHALDDAGTDDDHPARLLATDPSWAGAKP